jgi:hypothetical protein
VRRGGHAGHLFEQRDILGMPAELVVANQRAERIAAQSTVLFFVDLLENLALVEFDCLVQVLEQIVLADVHELDLEAAGSLLCLTKYSKPRHAPSSFCRARHALLRSAVLKSGRRGRRCGC